MLQFIIVVTEYRKFHESINAGCVLSQEHIQQKFAGVFVLLKKLHYVEFILSSIERSYGEIRYEDLNDVRVNSVSV